MLSCYNEFVTGYNYIHMSLVSREVSACIGFGIAESVIDSASAFPMQTIFSQTKPLL